jgi:signal recognition particle-docking protein FtsY
VSSVATAAGSVGTTTRQALEVGYNDAGADAGLPTRLFVKCTTALAQRLMLGLGGLIHGEPGFYNYVRPGLRIEAPGGYFGAVDPRTWRSIVVIEDVAAARRARFWGPSTPINRERIEDLLANAATWHGALWESPRLAAWRWLKTPAEQMRVIDALIGLADRTGVGTERARAVLPHAMVTRRADLYAAMRRSMALASRGSRTYLHVDLHIANTYLTGDGRLGIADWQIGLQGSWAYDFGYLLATALEPNDRRAWERDLLELYLDRSLGTARHGGRPGVLLVVGVNGAGKTTTVGKIARVLVGDGKSVVLGAADTFRAAAADQLETWGERVGVLTVRGREGGDPASVAFEAVRTGMEGEVDTVVIDTAGRLHTKSGLMDELGKVKRVVEKQAPVTETLLVLDATTGQNGVVQARVFTEAVAVTGVVLTKLDGTAKGGIVVSVQRELGIPVKLVGLGEGPDDLAPFEPEAFAEALVGGAD